MTDDQATSLRDSGTAMLERGAYGRAQALLGSYLLVDPGDTYLHSQLIRCFYEPRTKTNQVDECDAFYHDVVTRNPKPWLHAFVRAVRLVCERQASDAIDAFHEAIASGLDDAVVRHELALAYASLGSSEAAAEEFERALTHDSEFLPSLSVYASWLFGDGRFDRVESLCRGALGTPGRPRNAAFVGGDKAIDGLCALAKDVGAIREAIRLSNQGDWRSAVDKTWSVLHRRPFNVSLVRMFAFLCYRGEWLQMGEKRLHEILDEDSLIGRYTGGLILWYRNELEEAEAAYSQAVENGLENPLVRHAQALAWLELGREADALDELHELHRHQPWLACVRRTLARRAFIEGRLSAVLELGQIGDAERHYANEYEASGAAYLSVLEGLVIRALFHDGNLAAACGRVGSLEVSVKDEGLSLGVGVVCAAAGDYERADREFLDAYDARVFDRGCATLEEFRAVVAMHEEVPSALGAALIHARYSGVAAGDWQEVLSRLQDLAQRFPNEVRIWNAIAQIAFTNGDADTARHAAQKATSLPGEHENALQVLCAILADEEDAKGLQELAGQHLTSVAPLMRLHDITEEAEGRKRLVELVLERDTAGKIAPRFLGAMIDQGDVRPAYVELVLSRRPSCDSELRLIAARSLLRNGCAQESREVYDRLMSHGCDSPAVVLEYGLVALARA